MLHPAGEAESILKTFKVEVLRTVKSAAVFAPTIDVDRVVRQIPPYRAIVPARELPARPRLVSWLVAAALAIVVLGGGSLLLTQYRVMPAPVAVVTPEPSGQIPTPPTSVTSGAAEPLTSPSSVVASAQPHVLTLAADVDGLSDGSLVQLMDEMNRFDALPDSESDPVISVDTSYDLDQDPR